MATSGYFEQPFRTYYRLRIEWSQSKNTAENKSTVTVNVFVVSTSSNWGIESGSINTSYTIDGHTGSFYSTPFNNPGGQKIKIGSFSRTVTHGADGNRTVPISVSWPFNGTIAGGYVGTVTVSGTAVLDPILRVSQPRLSSTSFNMGDSITIFTDRASSSFTHIIRYTFGNTGGTISTNVGDSVTWQVPLSLAHQIPNSVTGYGHVICETYQSGKLIGTRTVKFYATVPHHIKPTINNIHIDEYETNVKNKVGAYVQKKSRLRIEIWASYIETAYSSPIKSYKIEFDGMMWNSWAAITNHISKSGILNVTATITDGRGRSASYTKQISVLPYEFPEITLAGVRRFNENQEEDPNGENVGLFFSGLISPLVISGTQKNKATWRIYSKLRGETEWGEPILSGEVTSGSSINPAIPILSGYELVRSYEFLFEIQDIFDMAYTIYVLSSGQYTLTLSKYGIGVGKTWEKGSVDAADDMYVKNNKVIHRGVVAQGRVYIAQGEEYINQIKTTPVSFGKTLPSNVRVFVTVVSFVSTSLTAYWVQNITDAGFELCTIKTNQWGMTFNWFAIADD